MYATYFGLIENPFSLTPDQKYLYLSRHHNEALDHLMYGINERKGFIAISGGIGTGKTTLCRALLNRLEPATKTALIFNTSISDIELLETINHEFGIDVPPGPVSKRTHLTALNRFLLANHRKNINSVLILDEAQNLTAGSLEQLRMLSNLETEKEKLIQVVLVGQPELMTLLDSPSLAQLNERITVRYHLPPLDRREVAGYIQHRLVVAGSRGNIRLRRSAIGAVFAYSKGNPRRINAICDRALLIAYCKDEFFITKDTIERAVEDIRGITEDAGEDVSRRRLFQAAAAVMAAFIVGSIAGWSLKDTVLPFFSAAEKITSVQAKAFFHRPGFDPEASGPAPAVKQIVRKPIASPATVSQFYMDDRTSLSTLFELFEDDGAEPSRGQEEIRPGVFSFKGDPVLYRQFTRPFRIRVRSRQGGAPGYLVIEKVTAEGAVGKDASGRKRAIDDRYLLTHWAGEMSWVYPYEPVSGKLSEGMSGLAVLRVQQMLNQLGYDVEPRGVFDRATFEEVMRYQLNQGLPANGVVDTATRALLYQMTG